MLLPGPIDCRPARVVRIVSGSRSGSSLLRALLVRSPDLTALDGEEEPYVRASGNGYGLTSSNDGFSGLENPVLFRRLLATELTGADPWGWRLCLQYPPGPRLARLLNRLPDMNSADPWPWLRREGIAGHYDGCARNERLPFREIAYEMPPFVLPRLGPRPTAGMTLLLKAPYNVYRPGMLETVWPGVPVTDVVLLRNPGATVNGLIDGWHAPYGFHKHQTPAGWWKFDLPPDPAPGDCPWSLTIPERAAWQWSCTARRLADWSGTVVRFEDLLADPDTVLDTLCRSLDVTPPPHGQGLPPVMTTLPPRPGRWWGRARVILPLLAEYRDLIRRLDYEDDSQWF